MGRSGRCPESETVCRFGCIRRRWRQPGDTGTPANGRRVISWYVGFSAASCREDETPKQTAQRVGMHKLGVSLVLGDVLGHGEQIKPSYILKMTLYRARLVDIEPRMPSTRMTSGGSVHDGDASAPTIYTGWRWGEPGELQNSARKGSLCSQLLLEKG